MLDDSGDEEAQPDREPRKDDQAGEHHDREDDRGFSRQATGRPFGEPAWARGQNVTAAARLEERRVTAKADTPRN